MKPAAFKRALAHGPRMVHGSELDPASRLDKLAVSVERRRSELRVVARTLEVTSSIVVEAVFSGGANAVSCSVLREGERRDFAGSTLAQHPALAAVLRLIADEAELRTRVRRIAFQPADTSTTQADNEQTNSDALLEFLFQSLLIYTERADVADPMPRWGRPIRDLPIERALARLNADIAKRWTVESLARAVGLSRPVFARRFVAVLGLSPMRYLAERRMQVAAALLFSSDCRLADVASRVGYDSEFAFGRAFKRHYHVPPGEYRRRVPATSSVGATSSMGARMAA